ncbi:DEAD/DEAH box helicase [Allobaculum sp. JKK-2023]|uniref:DEAD/DEAH box helicase n=1 Tax=Allobaculum sp. JKK-2023 TaxID=3108943 RepID=UPI002B05C720|nr:SNF2-related protein [Allobaculum sp. JKK-2023]
MILDANIDGTQFELLNTKRASKRAKEKVLIKAYGRSQGAFLSRLLLFDGAITSPQMKLLKRLALEFVTVINHIPGYVGTEDLYSSSSVRRIELHYDKATEIGEKLDDGIHSTFFYPENLRALFTEFYLDLNKYANRSSGSLLKLMREKKFSTVVDQLHFFLSDVPDNPDYPFAFLAMVPVKNKAGVQWLSIAKALKKQRRSYYGTSTLEKRLDQAAAGSEFIKRLIQTRLILQPLRLTDDEALQFMHDIPKFEELGIVCMLPEWMNNKSSKLQFIWSSENDGPGLISSETLLSYVPEMMYHGQPITEKEAKELLGRDEGYQKINNRWVDASHAQLTTLLERFQKLRESSQSLSTLFAMQGEGADGEEDVPELEISYEDWIMQRCGLNHPVEPHLLPPGFEPVLRPYQKQAYSWLDRMEQHHLGVILADDMGLGKTVEILSQIENMRNRNKKKILIVVPATLVGNWVAEIRKFAPWMSYTILDGKNEPPEGQVNSLITLVTYQKCLRSNYVTTVHWDCIILDEAQAIKNPQAQQTKKIKQLNADFKVALTGTPIENNLGELWSIFDFINPGLLGTRDEFSYFKNNAEGLAQLKQIIAPFVMRRMKTDKTIISDLPEKNEIEVHVDLSKEQVVLYRKEVETLEKTLREVPSFQAKFQILAAITKLKQICNHPAQFQKTGDYSVSRSGKFAALRDIAQTIAENDQKVIVFTQFAQIIPALVALLEKEFKQKGASIDGSTSTKARMKIVKDFQNGKLPFLVLSLKTAGVGLNLTAAQNVIHFDRWWNPAVENQASDRAFRIGQKNDVTVYKFVSTNTIEEVISTMLAQKQDLADQVINDLDAEKLTELTPEELMRAIQWRG